MAQDKHFNNLTAEGDVDVEGNINEKNLDFLPSTIASGDFANETLSFELDRRYAYELFIFVFRGTLELRFDSDDGDNYQYIVRDKSDMTLNHVTEDSSIPIITGGTNDVGAYKYYVVDTHSGTSGYWKMFGGGAGGNYRDIDTNTVVEATYDVTISPGDITLNIISSDSSVSYILKEVGRVQQ